MGVFHGTKYRLVVTASGSVGSGGEAEIEEVTNHQGFLAKIPHVPSAAAFEKAGYQAELYPRPDRSALVIDLLSATPGGPPVALLLPRAAGRILYVVCHPAVRAREGITLTAWHLKRTVLNLALALDELHGAGLLWTDANLSNALVDLGNPADPCRVTLIDLDNGHMVVTDRATGGTKVLRAPLGVAEFLAPELQEKDLSLVDRTRATDLYAFSIIAFMLLFDGVHPSAVRSNSGRATPLLHNLIRDGRTVFTPGWPSDPDLETVVSRAELSALPPPIRSLFEATLVGGHADPSRRPSARAWVQALQTWERTGPVFAAQPAPAFPPAPLPAPHLAPAAGRAPGTQQGGAVAAWAAGILGVAACLLVALFVAAAGPRSPERKNSTPADTRRPANPPADGRFDDAPALWREAAKEGK